ncbi:MAG: NAD-dependent epimerase/dehydratase family protein [Caulobacteraceae bacterium]
MEAAADGEPVTIFGNDYDTPDGTCIRDYIHVTDLAEAHVRALMALDGREGFCAYNLGTGAGVSVAEVIDAVGVAVGREVPTCAGDRRPGDPAVLVADISRAQAELAWRPRLSNLQTMALSAWRWRNRGKNLAPILAGESA